MEYNEFPSKDECHISGSESIKSHQQTKCFDATFDRNSGWAIAESDCMVKLIDRQANQVFFTTLGPVECFLGQLVLSNRKAHMNDADFNAMGYVIGKVFRKGERIYRQGEKGAEGEIHIHCEWGIGEIIGKGWKNTPNGNRTITTTGGPIHIWEACYLAPGTIAKKFTDKDGPYPQNDYPWAYTPEVSYQLHCQDLGNTTMSKEFQIAGTVGQSRRSEAVRIVFSGIQYRAHIQDIGWLPYAKSGEWSGSMGQAKRLEAIEMIAPVGCILTAQAHVANIGWMPPVVGNHITIGTTGQSKAIEAIRIKVSGA